MDALPRKVKMISLTELLIGVFYLLSGLKEQSTDHFTLCDGLVHPKRRYVSDDDIPDTAKGR